MKAIAIRLGAEMISYEIYKIIHLFGLFGMFLSLGGLVLYVMGGGTKSEILFEKGSRFSISHGVFMFLVLLGGFGMAARLQWHNDWPVRFYVGARHVGRFWQG